jgi:VIT1/CCC1 family predicted Fe2+/Mn2+ transporter
MKEFRRRTYMIDISPRVQKRILQYQRDEVTGHLLYERLAQSQRDENNREALFKMAEDEKQHAIVWAGYTGKTVAPNRLKIFLYLFLSRLMGFTFAIKLMEKTERFGAAEYRLIEAEIPEAKALSADEEAHEEMLMGMLDEERLRYVGSMVLGLNDALVELTGTIAGLTFALANTRLVALSGIITGIAATLSMAASNYLAERADGNAEAVKSSVYTGAAYLVTVVLMVLPFLLFPVHMYIAAFVVMLAVMIFIIFFFNYYISVAKSVPFLHRFGEMAGISIGVAFISFLIGLAAKNLLGIEV